MDDFWWWKKITGVAQKLKPIWLLDFIIKSLSSFFLQVDKKTHRYTRDVEEREEGGTPAIVESIRAGLVFQLKHSVGVKNILDKEHFYTK